MMILLNLIITGFIERDSGDTSSARTCRPPRITSFFDVQKEAVDLAAVARNFEAIASSSGRERELLNELINTLAIKENLLRSPFTEGAGLWRVRVKVDILPLL